MHTETASPEYVALLAQCLPALTHPFPVQFDPVSIQSRNISLAVKRKQKIKDGLQRMKNALTRQEQKLEANDEAIELLTGRLDTAKDNEKVSPPVFGQEWLTLPAGYRRMIASGTF
jgi:hypothetical protein